MNNPSIRYGQCDYTCTADCGHCKGEGPPVASSSRAVDLDLDVIEADLADVPAELFGVRTSGDGPMRRLIASVPALVAEVRRLRELPYWTGSWVQESIHDAVRAERDAARAEAERQRERADYNAAAVNANADEIVRLRAGAARVREALQAIRDLHHEIRTTTGVASVGGLLTQWTKQTCDYCSRTHVGGSEVVGYPCATVRALDAALDGAE